MRFPGGHAYISGLSKLPEMPLPAPFRVFSPPSSASAASPAGAQRALLYGRRSPLAGALLFFSIGAVSAAVACRTGCAISHRRLPFLG